MPALDDSAFSSLALTFRVMRLASVWRTRLERALRPHGMTVAVMRPLTYLMMLPEGTTQRDLALVMDTDCSALVRVLDLLEKEGLLARTPDAQDRRAKCLSLTPAGREKCAVFHRVAGEVEQTMKAGMTTQDTHTLVARMDALLTTAHVLPT
ncbi:MarR family transcriptional regulator [Acetobacter orleanensis]|nr:MarR family transcriptional regulator [Acetobacter orleanensis]KXV65409.1 MarR family transcriptional regulator [Acetobacter orleanensis]PCD80111.1 MarR family transcriptional regulator [Acetobacter orleanensis]